MSYGKRAASDNIKYSRPNRASRSSSSYVHKAGISSLKLISTSYPSKKSSSKRIIYDLRKLNND
jgi:hypothetical protein